MSETLQVADRPQLGKLSNRRLRGSGHVPAVLYGHGKDPLSLSVAADRLGAALRHGAKIVNLSGAASGQALLQDVQWDVFRQNVLHVDLLRVEAGDRVKVHVPLQLRGEAPGVNNGGVVELLMRDVEVEVAPASVPDVLHINVNHLELGHTLTLAAIEDLPAGATLIGDVGRAAVHCVLPTAGPEDATSIGSSAEPEVIGRAAKAAAETE